MSLQPGRIDVHHHLIPPAFAAAMARRGLAYVAGAPLALWDARKSLAVMEDQQIQAAILSLSAPGVYLGDIDEARALARECNEFAANLCARYPGRLGMFAVLPMPFTEDACREAIYALDTLRADGIGLLGSTDGVFLGDGRLGELMDELNRRKTVVFVHPNLHAGSAQLGLDLPGFLLEFVCDTTRAATNLIVSGTLEKYPDITWILAHAGGFLPYIAYRLSLANLMIDLAPALPQGMLSYVRRFYYETALSTSAAGLATLKELVEPSHILFGSDFPFAPAPVVANETSALDRMPLWSVAERDGINRGHALRLFPRFSQAGEVVAPRASYRRASWRVRARNMVARPLLIAADSMRNR